MKQNDYPHPSTLMLIEFNINEKSDDHNNNKEQIKRKEISSYVKEKGNVIA